jgi:hypothetical protein
MRTKPHLPRDDSFISSGGSGSGRVHARTRARYDDARVGHAPGSRVPSPREGWESGGVDPLAHPARRLCERFPNCS